MVTHNRLVELFGDSPAIIIAKKLNKPAVCLNYIDEEWVLTWTTGGKEEIIIHNVKSLKLEPLYEEKISYIGIGDKHRRNFKSEGGTIFNPEKCPCCYDGLSFKKFSKIEIKVDNAAAFYYNWDVIVTNQTSFTYLI